MSPVLYIRHTIHSYTHIHVWYNPCIPLYKKPGLSTVLSIGTSCKNTEKTHRLWSSSWQLQLRLRCHRQGERAVLELRAGVKQRERERVVSCQLCFTVTEVLFSLGWLWHHIMPLWHFCRGPVKLMQSLDKPWLGLVFQVQRRMWDKASNAYWLWSTSCHDHYCLRQNYIRADYRSDIQTVMPVISQHQSPTFMVMWQYYWQAKMWRSR